MFARIYSASAFALVALTALVAAGGPTQTVTVTATPSPTPGGQCNTGEITCCNQVQSAGTPAVSTLLGLLGIVVQDVNVPIGITCSPISVIGIGGNSCTAQPVCCQNNTFNGVVAIGCTPINISL
ncbi:hypothetical protein AX16_006005 [Volvariella volvacea WC 439]|nr:hypothetical protein AX16_006005 [Volvariella volvacea WC 439]